MTKTKTPQIIKAEIGKTYVFVNQHNYEMVETVTRITESSVFATKSTGGHEFRYSHKTFNGYIDTILKEIR